MHHYAAIDFVERTPFFICLLQNIAKGCFSYMVIGHLIENDGDIELSTGHRCIREKIFFVPHVALRHVTEAKKTRKIFRCQETLFAIFN